MEKSILVLEGGAMRNIDLVEVIRPESLRNEMKEIIKKASEKYNK